MLTQHTLTLTIVRKARYEMWSYKNARAQNVHY